MSATMQVRRGNRFVGAAVIAAVAVTAASWLSPAVQPAQAADQVYSFTTSGAHEVVVPAGAISVAVAAIGGSGARVVSSAERQPGSGAAVAAVLPVTPGETLTAVVGGNASGSVGGQNGGAYGNNPDATTAVRNGGGGGATDLRRGGAALGDRALVAGGGGGAGAFPESNGGSAVGTTGGVGVTGDVCGANAGGGTQTAGGAPGGRCDGTAGSSGSLGLGGIPGFRNSGNNMGAGGGGGYFGGGGGSPYGGGGAGSSYVDPLGTNVSMATGVLYAAPSITLTFRMTAATSISLELSQTNVVADGTSTFTATARVRDSESRPVLGETIAFSSTDADQQVGPVTDHGDGYYSAQVTSSTELRTFLIFATNVSVTPNMPSSASGTQTVGPPATLTFVDPPTIGPADGESEFPVTLTITDAQGRLVNFGPLSFGSSDPAHLPGPFLIPDTGILQTTLHTSTRAGTSTIFARIPGSSPLIETSFTFTQTAGAVQELQAALASPQIVADGVAQTTLTITAADEFGNPLAGQPLSVTSSDPDVGLGAVQDLGDGNYSADVTSSTQAGDATLTVIDASVTPALVRTVTLTQLAGAPTGAQLTLGEPWLYADGASETTLVAEIVDEFGNPVTGLPIGATSTDPGQRFSDAAETADGVYELRVRASQTVGTSTLSLGLISAPVLERRAGAPALQAITLAQPQIQDGQPAPLAEVLATTELEQRARAVVPGKDPAPAVKSAALAGTGSAPTLAGWGAAALLAAGGVLLMSRRARRRS